MLSSQIFIEPQSTQGMKNYTGNSWKGWEGKNTEIDWSESLGTSVWESKIALSNIIKMNVTTINFYLELFQLLCNFLD